MNRRSSHVYQVLLKPRMFMGAEYILGVSNLMLASIFVFALHDWWWIGVTVVTHAVLRVITKREPLMRQIYMTYAHQADKYDPWPSPLSRRSPRPRNLGRGELW